MPFGGRFSLELVEERPGLAVLRVSGRDVRSTFAGEAGGQKNHRYWNDEVAFRIVDGAKLADGWAAHYSLQTRVRPTPDSMVYSTRAVAGHHVDCACAACKDAAAAMAICESTRFDPAHGSASTLPRPPPDWDISELQVDLPPGWQREMVDGALHLESPSHDYLSAYRDTPRAVPTLDAFMRDERIEDTDIVAKHVLADGVVVAYHVGKRIYVRGSRTLATRNFRCAAIEPDVPSAETAAALCVALHL